MTISYPIERVDSRQVDISGLKYCRTMHALCHDRGTHHPEVQGSKSFHHRTVQEYDLVIKTFRTGKRVARAISLLTKFKSTHEVALLMIAEGTSDPALVGDVAWQERWIKYYGYLLGQLGG